MRIPLVFGGPADVVPGDAALMEGSVSLLEGVPTAAFLPASSGHEAGCTCCRPRTGAAEALAALFLARARGGTGWFQRVVVLATTEPGREAVRRALTGDAFGAARFRLDDPAAPAPGYRPAPEDAA